MCLHSPGVRNPSIDKEITFLQKLHQASHQNPEHLQQDILPRVLKHSCSEGQSTRCLQVFYSHKVCFFYVGKVAAAGTHNHQSDNDEIIGFNDNDAGIKICQGIRMSHDFFMPSQENT